MTGGAGGGERLHVERSGGLAGLTRSASLPLAELSDAEREALEECFRRTPAPPSGPDRFVYRLQAGGREAVVQEDRLPPDLVPVLERLAGTWN